MTPSRDEAARAASGAPRCYEWPRECEHDDDLDCHIAKSLQNPAFAQAWERLQATPTLSPDVDDPNGTVTCTCGDVFTGVNFADRMGQWRDHVARSHADV